MKNTNERSFSYWQKKAMQFSDLYSGATTPLSPSSIVARFLDDRTKLLLCLLPNKPIKRLLDLGCGSGPHIKLLINSATHITGVDYSKQMLKLAKQDLTHLTCPKGHSWELLHADAAKLPLKSRSYDAIIAMGLLDYVPSPLAVLQECRRVITPKGVCIVTIPKKPSVFSLLRNPLGDAVKRIIFHLPPVDNALTEEELKTLVGRAGFRVLSVKSLWSAMWMIKLTAS